MNASDRQVRRLFVAMESGDGVGRAAMKAGMHRNTAARHRGRGLLPSDRAEPRAYRTRPDPFHAEWPSLEAMLRAAPGLEAKTLFADLRARKPGVFRDGHLRTLQRRVKLWRATSGPEKVPFFPQEHRPGEAAQTDFTWATELGITIRGELYLTPDLTRRLAALVRSMGPGSKDRLLFPKARPNWRTIDRDITAAGLPKEDLRRGTLCLYSMRKSFSTHHRMCGTDDDMICRLMRHAGSSLNSRAYTDEDLLDLREPMRLLDERDRIERRGCRARKTCDTGSPDEPSRRS